MNGTPSTSTSDHPSFDRIILILLLAVLIMGGLACFHKPAYEGGFYAVLMVLVTSLGNILSAKFALTQTKPLPGTTMDMRAHTETPPTPTPMPIANTPPPPPLAS